MQKIVFVLAGVGAVGLLGIVGLALWITSLPMPFAAEPPAELKQPSVQTQEVSLTKKVFFEDRSLGTVTDILPVDDKENPKIGIAGLQGAVWVKPNGKALSSVPLGRGATHVDIVDVEGDGTFEYLNRGGHGWQDASLLDENGKVLWFYGSRSGRSKAAVNDMNAGDLDGDGVSEFVTGHNGGGGVHLLDKDGKMQWRQPDGNVWHVEIVDTDGNGTPEILHSNAGGQITVRDGKGGVISRAKPQPYFSEFSITHWPSENSLPRLLLVEDEKIWLLDLKGNTLASFEAAYSQGQGFARGTSVQFAKEEPSYWAVLVDFDWWDRSVLSVYDSKERLVYQETIDERCSSLQPLKKEGQETEVLLVGGNGRVWEYALKE